MPDPHAPDGESRRMPSGDAGLDATPWQAATTEGYIDAIESGRIYGWAWDSGDPERRVRIDVFHAGQHVETLCADRFRADLKGLDRLAGLDADGDGRHAFAWDIPAALRHAHPAEFHLCFHGTGHPLGRSARVAQAESVASNPEQTAHNIMLALAQRITGIEAAVSQAMQLGILLQHERRHGDTPERLLPHLGKGFQVWAGKIAGHFDSRLGEKTASLHEGLDETARATAAAIAQMEGFLVRTDEALKQTARQSDVRALSAEVRREMRRMIVAAFLAGAAGAAGGVWLLSRFVHL